MPVDLSAVRTEPTDHLRRLNLGKQPELIRAADAARLLGVCRQTVYNLVACGEVAAVRVSRSGLRIFRSSLAEYLERQLL